MKVLWSSIARTQTAAITFNEFVEWTASRPKTSHKEMKMKNKLQKHERLAFEKVRAFLDPFEINPTLRRRKRHWAIDVPVDVCGSSITIASSPKVDDQTLIAQIIQQVRKLLVRAGLVRVD